MNILLLLALILQTHRLQQRATGDVPSSDQRLHNHKTPQESSEPAPSFPERLKAAPPSSSSTHPEFDWRQLESTNYHTYISNLRAAGCPEQTIREIVTADVNATFAAQRAEVLANRYQRYKFWETGTNVDNANVELKRQKESVDEQMEQVLHELLGPNAIAQSTARDWNVAELNEGLNFLSPDKREAALALLLRNEGNDALIKRLSEARRPTENSDELNRILQTYEDKRAELARLLSPGEFEQLELSVSWTADNLRRGMANFNPTEAEFREIFRAWRAHDENLARLYGTRQPDPGNSQVFAQIKEALGEERYKQYKATWWDTRHTSTTIPAPPPQGFR